MKPLSKAVLLFIVLINLVACGVVESIDKDTREDRFKSMCNYETMIICGDDIPVDGNGTMMLLDSFIGTPDIQDEYKFMRVPMKGDCEDFVITFIELNIRSGYLQPGDARWVSGTLNGANHAWAIIKNKYIFDTFHEEGELLEIAFKNFQYESRFTIYKY